MGTLAITAMAMSLAEALRRLVGSICKILLEKSGKTPKLEPWTVFAWRRIARA
jgi:hypothetical protein